MLCPLMSRPSHRSPLRRPVFAAELRPPRAELATREGMDAWIDTYHAVRRLTRRGTFVFLTDSAVGAQEEDNLRHLVTNLGRDVPRERDRAVPDRRSTRSTTACRTPSARGRTGFPRWSCSAATRRVGHPAVRRARLAAARAAPRARSRARARRLGQSARRCRSARSTFLTDGNFNAEFYLTQVVSHHDAGACRAFLEVTRRRGADAAGRVRRVLLPQRESARRWRR